MFETTVNIRYLIKSFSSSLVDSYVTASLRHERKLRDDIFRKIEDRNGVFVPIEDRMLNSIDRAEAASGISLDAIDMKDKRPWGGKNIFEKTREVGLEQAYLAAFGGGSHSIHGNWQEIYASHLDWTASINEFTPNLKWQRPRPQVINALALIMTDTLKIYFAFVGGDELGACFDPKLDDLHDRVLDLVDSHEKYLASKRWPET